MPASSPLRPAAGRGPESPRRPDRELIETLERVAAERTCDAVACELDWWTLVGRLAALAGRWACRPLKFALVTVFAAYVAGWVERYVLPILRFLSQIP